MNVLKSILLPVKTTLVIAAMSLLAGLSFSSTVHAANVMTSMGSCVSNCLNQQSAFTVNDKQDEFRERKRDKDPQWKNVVPFYAQYLLLDVPQKIVARSVTLLATFRPPDIIRLSANFRF